MKKMKYDNSRACVDSFKIYVRGIRGASELRHQLMNTQSIAEARALLDEFEAQMDEDVKIEL